MKKSSELIKLNVICYDREDKNNYFEYYGSVQDIVANVKDYDYKDYELDLLVGKRMYSYEKKSICHFGVQLSSKYDFNTSIGLLCNYKLNNYIHGFKKRNNRKRKPDNTDYMYLVLNEIGYFNNVLLQSNNSKLNYVKKTIKQFCESSKDARQIKNLYEVDKMNGLYLLVFGKYNLCYIGQSMDIKKRIMEHWTKMDGKKVDVFRPLDNTSVFVIPIEAGKWDLLNKLEYELIQKVPQEVLLNNTFGGDPLWQAINRCGVFRYSDI